MSFARLSMLAIAAFAMLVLTGCSKPADKIVGVWGFDIASLEQSEDIKKLEGEQKKAALEMAKKMMGEMSFEFTKDGKLKMAFGKMVKEGTYTVKGTEGAVVTVETKVKEGEKGKEKEKVEELKLEVAGGKLKITGPDGKSLSFVKK